MATSGQSLFQQCCAVLSRSVVSTLCNPLDYSLPGSSVPGDSPGKNTKVGCHALLQRILPTLGSNLGPQHCRWVLYYLSHQGSPISAKLSKLKSLHGYMHMWSRSKSHQDSHGLECWPPRLSHKAWGCLPQVFELQAGCKRCNLISWWLASRQGCLYLGLPLLNPLWLLPWFLLWESWTSGEINLFYPLKDKQRKWLFSPCAWFDPYGSDAIFLSSYIKCPS